MVNSISYSENRIEFEATSLPSSEHTPSRLKEYIAQVQDIRHEVIQKWRTSRPPPDTYNLPSDFFLRVNFQSTNFPGSIGSVSDRKPTPQSFKKNIYPINHQPTNLPGTKKKSPPKFRVPQNATKRHAMPCWKHDGKQNLWSKVQRAPWPEDSSIGSDRAGKVGELSDKW